MYEDDGTQADEENDYWAQQEAFWADYREQLEGEEDVDFL